MQDTNMSAPSFYNQMAPFWDFIADLEERGFGRRRGANRWANRATTDGETAEANNIERQNPWAGAAAGFPAGPMPHRRRHGHGPGRRHGHRHQHAEPAVEQQEVGVLTPETEKETDNEKVPFEPVETDAENVASGNEGRRGPGARRGGRGGRGGRGNGLGRGRFARAAAREGNNAEANFSVPVGRENRREPGARRGGPVGRGAGRGAGRGMGRGMGGGRGMGRGMEAHPGHFGPWAMYHGMAGGPHGPAFGPRGGRRGLGRGAQGFGPFMAPHAAFVARAPQFQHGNGPRGPGARRGGPMGPRGRGMGAGRGRGMGVARGNGAAGFARGFRQQTQGNQQQFAAGPQAGPARRRQNQRPAGPRAAGPNRRQDAPQGGRAMRRNPGPNAKRNNGKFRPAVDVYNHPEAFIVHASLPGAKKEDVEVNWNAERSVLIITGHIDRSGDEEFMKTAAISERKVGEFQRRVRLAGPRIKNTSPIEAELINARMEDGVLKVELPKLDSGYVEVKKVDIK